MGITDFFDNGKTKECVRFAALSQVDCLKVKIIIGKDVQEYTESIENMNVKSWSHYKFYELQ